MRPPDPLCYASGRPAGCLREINQNDCPGILKMLESTDCRISTGKFPEFIIAVIKRSLKQQRLK